MGGAHDRALPNDNSAVILNMPWLFLRVCIYVKWSSKVVTGLFRRSRLLWPKKTPRDHLPKKHVVDTIAEWHGPCNTK